MTKTQRTAGELIALARKYYGDHAPALYADVEEQVVHPKCSDIGVTAVRIEADGTWREGWYRPNHGFRKM